MGLVFCVQCWSGAGGSALWFQKVSFSKKGGLTALCNFRQDTERSFKASAQPLGKNTSFLIQTNMSGERTLG